MRPTAYDHAVRLLTDAAAVRFASINAVIGIAKGGIAPAAALTAAGHRAVIVTADPDDHWPTKITALRAYTSQPILNHFEPMAEALARLHGMRIGTSHAEAFHPLPVLGRVPAAEGL